ncbi:hypothetical protein V2J09_020700 [Rumex salicifolius]
MDPASSPNDELLPNDDLQNPASERLMSSNSEAARHRAEKPLKSGLRWLEWRYKLFSIVAPPEGGDSSEEEMGGDVREEEISDGAREEEMGAGAGEVEALVEAEMNRWAACERRRR